MLRILLIIVVALAVIIGLMRLTGTRPGADAVVEDAAEAAAGIEASPTADEAMSAAGDAAEAAVGAGEEAVDAAGEVIEDSGEEAVDVLDEAAEELEEAAAPQPE